jgi:uncharacterized membrane-anchored protein YitT (DUF2179 family)
MEVKKNRHRVKIFYPGLVLGSVFDAFGYAGFLVPNKLNMGGVAGLATILYYLINVPVGVLYFCLNIPIFVWAYFKLDKRILLTTFLTVLLNSIFMDLFMYLLHHTAVTNDMFLAIIYGASMSGLGIGFTFRSHGSLGGTDLLAQVIYTYVNLPFGQILILLDATVIIASAIIFKNSNLALLPLIGLFILGKVIDLVQEGLSSSKAAMIITAKPEEIKQFILEEMNRGVTILTGQGGFTKEGKGILICAFSQSQHTILKQEVHYIDPHAFIMIGTLDEVLGEGFEKRF